MRTNAAFLVVVILTGSSLLLAFWGCGTGPLEQPYAIQSGAEPVSFAIGEQTDLPDLMKRMRFAQLNLSDRLTSGNSEDIVRAAVQVSLVAGEVGKYQPAIALESDDEAASFKRLANEVQDMAVEVAKAADGGRLGAADQFYVRLYLACNECHRLFRGAVGPSEPMEIPELETPKPPEEVPPDAGTLLPIPEPGPAPAPDEPLPAPPEL